MICCTNLNRLRISEFFPENLNNDHINFDRARTPTPPPLNTERRRHPTNAKKRLYESWKTLLPDLLDPLLVYLSSSMGRLQAPVAGDIAQSCSDPRHDAKTSKVLCLYFNREEHSCISAVRCSQRLSQTFAQSMSLAVNVSPSRSCSFTTASSQQHHLNRVWPSLSNFSIFFAASSSNRVTPQTHCRSQSSHSTLAEDLS
jgi:hypothetical protein